MSTQEQPDFSQRVYAAILPVAERYVLESGRPDRVRVAPFDPDSELLDFTVTHFTAKPYRTLNEQAGKLIINKFVGMPSRILEGVMVDAFAEHTDQLVESRLERPLVHLADHTPNLLPVASQFAGNIALARELKGGTSNSRLRGLIDKSHGVGTIGYRPLMIHFLPKLLPGIPISSIGRSLTHTHFSIPATEQYRKLGWPKGDVTRYNKSFAMKLMGALGEASEATAPHVSGRVRPSNLHPECVINPVGTKQLDRGDQIVIPQAVDATGQLVDFIKADILPVYTSFDFDEAGKKIVAGHCEVGDVVPFSEGQGGDVIRTYLTRLAEYRSEREDREVVYAGAAQAA